jgi:hypothetical protein
MDDRPPIVSSFPSWLILLALVLGAAGCRSQSCELVEAELRDREVKIAELKHELGRRDCDLRTLQMELERQERVRTGKPAEAAGFTCSISRIVLGKSTGGHDADPRCPGDEGILIVLEPHDADDQSVKAPGSLHVEALEINAQGLKTPLSTWDVSAADLRKHWETPVLSSPAYRVPLSWQRLPASEKLRVTVQFTTPNGVPFEADRDITVRLPRQEPSHGPLLQPADERLPPSHRLENTSEMQEVTPASMSRVHLRKPVRADWRVSGS